jgi:quinol monooxygenase YgiN
MNRCAAMVRFQATPGKGAEVAALVGAALPKTASETGMPLWLVLHSSQEPDVVYIVDVFDSPEDRDAHLSHATAAQIIATVPPHLAVPLTIDGCALIAAKGL